MSQQERVGKLWTTLEGSGGLEDRLGALEDLEIWLEPSPESVFRLRRLQSKAPPPLARALGRTCLRMRRQKAQKELLTAGSSSSLDEHRVQQALDQARAALKDPEARTRADYLNQVLREERFEVAPVLARAALTERDERVQTRLARAVGTLVAESAVGVLEKLARRGSPRVRLGVVEGLAFQSGGPRLQLLLRLRTASDPGVREAAAEVLGEVSLDSLRQAAAAAGSDQARLERIVEMVVGDRAGGGEASEATADEIFRSAFPPGS